MIVPQGTNVIRGLYYIDSETDSDFLFIAALNNNPIVKEINTRMKVFHQQVTTGEIAFRFKNTVHCFVMVRANRNPYILVTN